MLFYPVQYEGEEMSPNVFYTGAAPNQQAIPAVEYLMSGTAAARNASSCWERTTFTRAPRTRSCAPSCTRKAWKIKILKRSTPHLVIAITRPSSPVSRNSLRAVKRRWSPPSTVIPTCLSIKSWRTGAESHGRAGGGVLGGRGGTARH